ncbi:MAG TPA: ATP-binding protein, partial [Tepidisphaeraceae bacterium]|nr:ATP-binding protein [Tepidisphaeraceae bacterium]
MEGWGWQAVHDPAEVQRVVEKFRRHVASGDPWEDTFPLRRHDGVYRWHLSRALPLHDDHGDIQMWFGTNTDVTEERDRAQERQRLLDAERVARGAAEAARAEAEQANRVKDEFLAVVSHELRTPLTSVLGWANLLRRDPDIADHPDIAEGLEIIERNAKAQAQLIDDLLDIARITTGKLRLEPAVTDLVPVIEAAVASVHLAAEAKGVALVTRLDPHVGGVLGDAVRLQQIVWNLLANAVKFTPRGGTVTARLQTGEADGGGVIVTVSDTGEGIGPDLLPFVFDRFRQADSAMTRRYGGLGLGLAIVRHLTELHGGQVTAQSEGKGRGATFTVRLPLAAQVAGGGGGAAGPLRARPPGPVPAECPPTLDGLQVLVVEDEPDARSMMARALSECGATVRTAGSAAEAMAAIDERVPAVLVSDVGMPGEDGYTLLRRLRQRPADRGGQVPAIAVTAFAGADDRARATAAGFHDHVAKPVTPNALATAVATVARSEQSAESQVNAD